MFGAQLDHDDSFLDEITDFFSSDSDTSFTDVEVNHATPELDAETSRGVFKKPMRACSSMAVMAQPQYTMVTQHRSPIRTRVKP